jgi:hypothetical protein
MCQRFTSVSAHFDYMRVADTIYSQKSEDRDITDKLLNVAGDNQSAANAITNILLSHG